MRLLNPEAIFVDIQYLYVYLKSLEAEPYKKASEQLTKKAFNLTDSENTQPRINPKSLIT